MIAQLVLRALPEEEEEEEERKISVSAENSRINNSQKDSSNLKYYLKKAFDEQLNRYFGTKTSFSKASNKIFRALNDSIKRLALKSSEKGTVLVVTKYKVISDLQ